MKKFLTKSIVYLPNLAKKYIFGKPNLLYFGFMQLAYQEFVFSMPLAPYESRLLRRAVLKSLSGDKLWYHHHLEDGYWYRYPLIQYKSIRGKAAILYLGKGIEKIADLFLDGRRPVEVDGRVFDFKAEKIHAKLYDLQVRDETVFAYDLLHWLPLQDDNFVTYRRMEDEDEKKEFLRKMLVSNILAFAKGVGWTIEKPVEIADFTIDKRQWISYKDVKHLGFRVHFRTNVFLPPHIGLGKGAAHNYGVVFYRRKRKIPTEEHHESTE